MHDKFTLSAVRLGIAAHWDKYPCGAHALAIIDGLVREPLRVEYSIGDLMTAGEISELSEVIPALAILAQSEFAILNPCASADGRPTGAFALTHTLKG